MLQLVANLLAAHKIDLEKLEGMSPATRQKAQQKPAKFTAKIGYPDRWRNYDALQFASDDLFRNVSRRQAFEYDRNLNSWGRRWIAPSGR